MIKEINDFKEFIEIVDKQRYKNKDIVEAMAYGYKNIPSLYRTIEFKEYCKYFVILDRNQQDVLCTIVLDRSGFLHFFVTTNLTYKNMFVFIKDIKLLANKYVTELGSIFVSTLNSYDEAKRLNKIIGFRPYVIRDLYTIWVMDNGKQDRNYT